MKLKMANLRFDNAGYTNKVNKIIENDNQEGLQNFLTNEIERRIKLLKKADESFLNSILSFAIYQKNSWMFEHLNNDISEMGFAFDKAIKNKDEMYDLKIWHFMKNNFTKIPDKDLNIFSEGSFKTIYDYKTNYKFKDGQYSADNGLAHASILKSKNPKGNGEIIHLTFRGTEFSKLFQYIKGPYLDMSSYYQNFFPLIEHLRVYVNDPKNNISEIQVSGHSLGGAMVQEFLKNNPPESFNVPIKGFTFGSPGAEKKFYHKFITLAYHGIARGVNLSHIIKVNNINNNYNYDERLTQYYHNNDPVPLVGLLGYTKGGNNHALPDVSYKKDKKANLEMPTFLEKIPSFGKLVTFFKENLINKFNTKFHDSKRYIINLRSYIDHHYDDKILSTGISKGNTFNWQKWNKNEKIFGTLSVKYRSAFESLIKQQNPQLDEDKITEEILVIRERMKYDSLCDVILSQTNSIHNTYDKNLINKFYISRDGTLTNQFGIVIQKSFLEEEQQEDKTKTLNTVECVDKIQRMRKSYEDKMEARAVLFKKSN